MMRVSAEGLRNDLLELRFDLVDGLAGRESRAIADAEHVRVDGERFLTECGVEHDIGCLSADARQRLQLLARPRNLALVLVDQSLAERDDVLRLGVEQADRLDRLAQPILSEIEHLLRRFDALEERFRGDIHARVGSLGGKHHSNQKLVGVGGFELGRRRGVGLRKAAEEFENLIASHREPITSRIE